MTNATANQIAFIQKLRAERAQLPTITSADQWKMVATDADGAVEIIRLNPFMSQVLRMPAWSSTSSRA